MPTFDRAANQQALDAVFGAGKVQAGEGRGDAYLKQYATPQQRAQYESLRRAAGDSSYSVASLGPVSNTVGLDQQMAQNVNNPVLPSGTTLTPIMQNVQSNELMNAGNYQLGPAPTIAAASPIVAPTIQTSTAAPAAQVNADEVLNYLNQNVGQVEATKVGNQTPQATAQQGSVSELATVQGQLAKLYADADGKVPEWAVGAQLAAKEEMARRGMGNSSISVAALTSAYMQSALPIAAADAATYFQMDMKNLDNRQQTELTNVQMRQQSLLTDVAIDNAAKQFNASSSQQLQQFTAGLVSQIQEQNATRKTAIEQFNAAEKNKIEAQNANNSIAVQSANQQTKLAIDKFNADMISQRETFNATMAAQIDQANIAWRRQINTQNTAAANASNAQNVQNAFQISNQASANLWMAYRDYAQWSFTAAQNAETRAYNTAMAANNQKAAKDQNEANMLFQAAQFLPSILSNIDF